MKDEKGFSIIELIIVCLVIAILMTASIPTMQRSLQLYRLETVSGLLSNRLTEAKLTAVKYNRAAWLQVNTTNRTLEVFTTDSSGTIRVGTVVPIPSGVSINTTAATQVTFTSLGRNQSASSSVIKFSLSGTSNCKSITISAIGNIAITTGC